MEKYCFSNDLKEDPDFVMLMPQVDPSRIILSRVGSEDLPFMDFLITDAGHQRPEMISPAAWRGCVHALRAAGRLPEPDGVLSGYFLTAAYEPLIGISPQPAYSPDPKAGSDAESWFYAYSCDRSLEAMKREADEDFKHMSEEIEDCDGPDIPMPCRVYDNGDIELLQFLGDDADNDVIARHSVRDIYKYAFGMDVPDIEPDSLDI